MEGVERVKHVMVWDAEWRAGKRLNTWWCEMQNEGQGKRLNAWWCEMEDEGEETRGRCGHCGVEEKDITASKRRKKPKTKKQTKTSWCDHNWRNLKQRTGTTNLGAGHSISLTRGDQTGIAQVEWFCQARRWHHPRVQAAGFYPEVSGAWVTVFLLWAPGVNVRRREIVLSCESGRQLGRPNVAEFKGDASQGSLPSTGRLMPDWLIDWLACLIN